MAENNRRQVNSRDSLDDNRNDLALLGEYARSLNKSADALLKASSKFDTTVSGLGQNNRQEINRLQSILSNFASSFGKEMERIEDNVTEERAKTDGQSLTNIDRVMRKDHESRESTLSKTQKIGNSLIKTFGIVVDYAIDKFKTGFYSIVDNFNDNLTSITVRMQQSNRMYGEMLRDSTDWIKNNGLDKQFSQIDWSNSLLSVLDTGIRGQTAQEMAYQNMVTNKLLPMINTNTRAYTRMSKTFGEEFTKGMTAIGTYTEKLYGAEGLEEGGFDNFIEQIGLQVETAVRENGGSAEDVSRIMQNFLGSYTENARKFGPEVAENMLGQFAKALNNLTAEGDVMSLIAGKETNIIGGNLAGLNENTLGDFFNSIVSQYTQQGGDQSNIAWTNDAGIGDLKTARTIRNAVYFGNTDGVSDWRSIASQYSASGEYQGQIDKLKDGQYQNLTNQQIKFNENVMADLGDLAAETIPDVKNILDRVSEILKIWFTTWLGWKSVSKAKDVVSGTSKFSSLFGKAGSGVGAGSEATGGASAVGGGALSTVAGVGAIIAGTALAVKDGITSSNKFINEGYTLDTSIGQGMRSAVTGHSGMTGSEEVSATQAALNGQKREFSWSELGLNAGKGALIGGGIGTVIPGAGTIAGGVVGGVVGTLTNAVDQVVENWKYNDLAEASNNLRDSLTKLDEASQNYEDTVKKGESSQKMLTFISENRNSQDEKTIEQSKLYFEQLRDLYPEQLGNIESLEELNKQDSSYIDIIKQKIELEKRDSINYLAKDAGNVGSKVDELIEKLVDKPEDIKSTASVEFAKWASQNYSQGVSPSSSVLDDKLSELSKQYNIDKADLVKELNSGKSGEILKLDDKGSPIGLKTVTFGNNSEQFVEDYKESESKRNNVIASLKMMNDSLASSYRDLSVAVMGADLDASGHVSESEYRDIYESARKFNESVRKTKDAATKYSLSGYSPRKDQFKGIDEVYDRIEGVVTPQFRSGSYRTREGLAYLHNDEMVLTKSQADLFRDVSQGGNVSQFLSNLTRKNQGKVETVQEDTSSSLDPVISAVQSQTEELSSILNSILEVITKLSPDSKFRSAISATPLPSALLEFRGS